MKYIKLLFIYLLLPISVFAYSDQIIVSGEPIGIEIHSKGIYVADFYPVANKWIGKEAGLIKGDRIIKVNNKDIDNLIDFNSIITKPGTYNLEINRNNKIKNINLNVVKEDNIIKTGLYVKDQVNGIGTLSYIDPSTRIYASLGHEIEEKTNNKPFVIKNGYIYNTTINYIEKSRDGSIGEIHANFSNEIEGTIEKNEANGIFGKYLGNIDKDDTMPIAHKDEIKKGDAYLRMKIGSNVNDYKIKIISVNENDSVKNIYFEIVDDELINETGGVVQGMSGTPIIQNDKIIGVVNYVIVNNSNQGYGIFIETMLESGDKILNE